jgi:hypothetical protein
MIREPHAARSEPGLAQTLLAVLAADWAGALTGAFVSAVAGDGLAATGASLLAATVAGLLVLPTLARVLAGAVLPAPSAAAALLAGNVAALGSHALFSAPPAGTNDGIPSFGSTSAFLVGVAVSWWLVRAAAEPAPRSHPLVLDAAPDRTAFAWLSFGLAVVVAMIGIGALAERGLTLRPAAHAYDARLDRAQRRTIAVLRRVEAGGNVPRGETTLRREAQLLADTDAPPSARATNRELVRALRALSLHLPAIARARNRHRVEALLPDWQRVHGSFAHLDRLGYGHLDARGWTSLLARPKRRG